MDLNKFSGKRICVAVSGGQDSVALLHYLKTGEEKYGYSLSAVHCEHGIRGEESIKDAGFVVGLCKKMGVDCRVYREDCPKKAVLEKTSLETAARDFRYGCFSSIVNEGGADYVATAHHLDDEAETVLFRIARGTLSGAKGIEEENGYLIRPFLRRTKAEIVEYAEKNGLSYREDKSNFIPDVTRNKLRLEILPKLEEAINGASENIARFAFRLGEDDALLYELADGLLSEKEDGDIEVAFSGKKPLFYRACVTAMKGLGIVKDYTSAHLDGLFSLQSSERGAGVDLPQGVRAEKTEKGILFSAKKEEVFLPRAEEKPFSEEGFDGGRYEVKIEKEPPVGAYEGKLLRADGDSIPKGAVFRFRKEGDFIRRFGTGKKSLKKFFNEEKIPPKERDHIPLIAEKEGSEVYAVCGAEISETIKIKEETRNALYITTRKKEN